MKKYFLLLLFTAISYAQTTISDRSGKSIIVNSPATTTAKGIIKLAGDLSGTADVPTVPGLTSKEPTISAGTTSQYWRGDKTWQTLDIATIKEHTYNRYVTTDGNDTSGKGTQANPYLTIAKAVVGAQFPFSLHLAGQTFTENITIASGQSNFNLIADNSSRARQTTILSGTISTQSGFTRLGVKGLTISSGTAIPLTFGSGDLGRHSFENVSIETTNTSIASFNANFTNWINFFGCDFPTASVLTLPNLTGSAVIRLYDCGAVNISVGNGWTVYTNGDTVLNHIATPSSTSLIVDLKTVRTVGVITTQAALTALIGTASGSDGAYIINFSLPTGITGLGQGDIILKVSGNQGVIYKFLDAPASIIQYTGTTTQVTWVKSSTGWSIAAPVASPIFTGTVSAPSFISTVATGTAPLVVTSTTPVANLSIGGNAATVTTNANLTGDVTSMGNATTIGASKVVTGMIADGTIAVADLADNAVETAKIKDANVTYAKIQNVSATDKVLGRISTGAGVVEEIATIGSGNVVRAISPTLTTPVLGVASATSINKVTVTAPSTSATLTIADGKTLTASDNATVSGTNTGDQTITLTGDVTGTGTGSFATTVGKINGTSLAGLATGILKNTTTTGVPSIAVAADFPTLNQNTTGTASNVTGTVVIANGGTGATTASAALTNLGAAPLASPTFTGTVSGVTSTMVGLGNVDNTSDINKPISTATQTALDLKANLASPALTGTPTAPTAANGTKTTQIATTAFVNSGFLPLAGGTVTGDINGTALTLNNNGGANTTTIGAGTTTGAVTIGGTGAQSIDVGTGAALKTVTVGSSNSTSSTTLRGGTGTGAITLTPATAGTIVVGNTAGTGAITLGSSSAAQTTNVGTGAGASTVNIANGAGANTVTVGGTGGASATTIQAGTGNLNITSGNSPIIFNTNGTEKMRLLTDGTLCVGTTTASGFGSRFMIRHTGGTDNGLIVQNSNTNSSYALVTVSSTGALIGGVTVTSTGTGFATTSDYRLKKDFKDFDGLSLVNKIKMYDYAWKSDDSRMFGVKAHELQEVIPYAVFGEKDGVDADGKPKYQTVDYGKLTPILIKAVQEQQVEIEKQQVEIEKQQVQIEKQQVQIDELKAQVQELINKLKI
jgi:hypothetical protein